MGYPRIGIGVFVGTNSGGGETQYIVAEGGIATRDGDYIVRTFPAGTFDLNVISNTGNYDLTILGSAAGGAGGGTNNGGAGGGGGGDVLEVTFTPTVRSYALTVGVGGVAVGRNTGTNGANTTFETESGTETLLGGGGGGSGESSTSGDGGSGGSAGGNGYNRPIRVATANGNNVNLGGVTPAIYDGGAGGGGADSVGLDTTSADGANGGAGYASSISGTLKYYGAGGGGGSFSNPNPGLGGSSTGGNGGYTFGGALQLPTNPIANSGSGGGGAGNYLTVDDKVGSNGADGVVIVRYLSPDPIEYFLYETILENNDY